jgi:hypothetical protein
MESKMNGQEANYSTDDLLWWRWKYGGPREFWVTQVMAIEKFIKDGHLMPVDPAHLTSSPAVLQMNAEGRAVFIPKPFPGGIRVAHLHFKGNIYMLKQEEWNAFSKQMLDTYRDKLSKVKTVPFDSLISIVEAAERMG